jgi:hypothetical protein
VLALYDEGLADGGYVWNASRTSFGQLAEAMRDGRRPVESLPGPEPAPGMQADGVVAERTADGTCPI